MAGTLPTQILVFTSKYYVLNTLVNALRIQEKKNLPRRSVDDYFFASGFFAGRELGRADKVIGICFQFHSIFTRVVKKQRAALLVKRGKVFSLCFYFAPNWERGRVQELNIRQWE